MVNLAWAVASLAAAFAVLAAAFAVLAATSWVVLAATSSTAVTADTTRAGTNLGLAAFIRIIYSRINLNLLKAFN